MITPVLCENNTNDSMEVYAVRARLIQIGHEFLHDGPDGASMAALLFDIARRGSDDVVMRAAWLLVGAMERVPRTIQ